MYRAALSPAALCRAGELITAAASPAFAIAGAVGLVILIFRRVDLSRKLLLVVSLPIVVQFVMLASEKPGEYARFALFPAIVLMLCAIMEIGRLPRFRSIAAGVLCAACAVWSIGYVWHFGRDSIERTPRIIVAERLEATRERGARTLAVYSDPAPYCLPPVNLFEWKILLLDPGAAPPDDVDVLIKPVDEVAATTMPMRGYQILYWTRPRLLNTPISWASKPFQAIVKRDFAEH
jgi:hypothetical protein